MEILIWLIIVIVFVSIIFITNTIELSTNFIDHTLYPELYILNTPRTKNILWTDLITSIETPRWIEFDVLACQSATFTPTLDIIRSNYIPLNQTRPCIFPLIAFSRYIQENVEINTKTIKIANRLGHIAHTFVLSVPKYSLININPNSYGSTGDILCYIPYTTSSSDISISWDTHTKSFTYTNYLLVATPSSSSSHKIINNSQDIKYILVIAINL